VRNEVGESLAMRRRGARWDLALESHILGEWDLDLATGTGSHSIIAAPYFGSGCEAGAWVFDTFVRHVHPDDCAGMRRAFDPAALASKEFSSECRIVLPDGGVRWINLRAICEWEGGTPRRVFGIVIDNTEQKHTAELLIALQRREAENRRLPALNRLTTQVLADLSHELRTPLSAIIGFSELLGSGTVSAESPKFDQFLGHILTAGHKLLRLINEMFDPAHVEAGSLQFHPDRVNLADVTKEVVNALPTDILGLAHISLDIDPALPDLLLDPARLKQVLSHYIMIAVHSAARGGHVAVRGLLQDSSHLCLEIEALDISLSTDSARPPDAQLELPLPCSSLALELCRSLVEAQGGTTKMRCEPGKGGFIQIILGTVQGAQ
jgi:His Kinase A (phospho-acceptor) domain/PAS fold